MAIHPVQELPTVTSRLELGFPAARSQWCETPALFTALVEAALAGERVLRLKGGLAQIEFYQESLQVLGKRQKSTSA